MKLSRIRLFELLFLLVVIALGAKLMRPKPKVVVQVPAVEDLGFDRISQAYEQKRYSECESLCRRQLLVDPDDLYLYRRLGMSLREQNKDKEAKQVFDLAIRRCATVGDMYGLANSYGSVHSELSSLHRERGNLLRKTSGWGEAAYDYGVVVKMEEETGRWPSADMLNLAGLSTFAWTKSKESASLYFEYADDRAYPKKDDSSLQIHLQRCRSPKTTAQCDLPDCPLCMVSGKP